MTGLSGSTPRNTPTFISNSQKPSSAGPLLGLRRCSSSYPVHGPNSSSSFFSPPFFSNPSAKKPNAIFALTLHGGHLGFFEGAVLFPQPLTWMDKVIVGYANAMCQYEKQKPPCQSPCTEGKA